MSEFNELGNQLEVKEISLRGNLVLTSSFSVVLVTVAATEVVSLFPNNLPLSQPSARAHSARPDTMSTTYQVYYSPCHKIS